MKVLSVKFYYHRARVLGYLMVFSLLAYFVFRLFTKASL
jgi:hypothetical protein